LVTTLTNQNDIHDEIKSRLNSGNARCIRGSESVRGDWWLVILYGPLHENQTRQRIHSLPIGTAWKTGFVQAF